MESEQQSSPQALDVLRQARSQRAVLYQQLEGACLQLLATFDEDAYQRLLSEVTPSFSSCSTTVRQAQASAAAAGQQEFSEACESLQQLEKRMLQTTLQLHNTKYGIQRARNPEAGDHNHSCQELGVQPAASTDVIRDLQLAASKLELEAQTNVGSQQINASSADHKRSEMATGGDLVHTHDGEGDPADGSLHDVLKATIQQLEDVVQEINDLWDEILEPDT